MRGAWAIGVGLGLGVSCIRAAAYPCTEDGQCDLEPMGVCVQPEGYCAYPDETCEGLRFETRAPGELADACVEVEVECGGPNQPCCEDFECNQPLVCFGDGCSCMVDLVVGDAHTCALRSDNKLECWGGNVRHALGRNEAAQSFTDPAPVVDLPQPLVVSSIQARGHTCLVDLAGDIWCWGDNSNGQADPESEEEAVPVATKLDLGLQEFGWLPEFIGVGLGHTCASGESGVFCWGDNELGQLGWPGPDTPDQVDTSGVIGYIVELAAGFGHTCVRTVGETSEAPTEQRVFCWGDDSDGQLGNGPGEMSSTVPVEVELDPNLAIVSIAASDVHTCVVAYEADAVDTRQVYCWGSDDWGAVTGKEGGAIVESPTLVEGLPELPFESVTANYLHTCVAAEDEGVWCWGTNEAGVVSPLEGNELLAPTRVESEDERGVFLYSVGVGYTHSCGLASDGTATCWGCGGVGQLGDEWLFCDENEGGWGAVRSQCG